MRRSIVFVVTAASLFFVFVSGAEAAPGATASGLKQDAAEIDAVQKVVRVCQHNMFNSRRVCFVDRSRPPTVCHHLRSSSRRDCY